MKVGYVLLDGCADRPNEALGLKTPLQAASTPSLDRLVSAGRMGRVVTVGEGIAPESDIAVFSMLGYAFPEGYPGRGVIEAIGAGVDFKDGDLALRVNFATTVDRAITDRRAGRDLTPADVKALEEDLAGVQLGTDFEFRGTISYRGVLVIRGSKPLSGEISNTDPAYLRLNGFGTATAIKKGETVQECQPLIGSEAAKEAARLVNEFTVKAVAILAESKTNKERLRAGKKPANALLMRDAGDHLPKVKSFQERHGMKGVALVEMPAEVGIARLLGMKMVKVGSGSDLGTTFSRFKRELDDNTLVYVHIKGPDEFAHEGDALGKKKSIETADKTFFTGVPDLISDTKIIVSCDHATPCALKMHTSDPVPLLVTGSKPDPRCHRFTEEDAGLGSLGTLKGTSLLDTVLPL